MLIYLLPDVCVLFPFEQKMDKKQTKVKVMIRVRPPLSESEKTCVSVDDKIVKIFNHRNITENIHYRYICLNIIVIFLSYFKKDEDETFMKAVVETKKILVST